MPSNPANYTTLALAIEKDYLGDENTPQKGNGAYEHYKDSVAKDHPYEMPGLHGRSKGGGKAVSQRGLSALAVSLCERSI